MDVCRTAIRLGAKDTYIIYRRSQAEMPADAEEVAEAMEEGVQFRFLSAPAEILGENGKVKALKVELMELGEPDAKGRRKPVGTGKFETIEVTSVIGAIGQRVDLGRIAPEAMVFNRNGTVQADGVTYQTAQPDIFAGGDVVTGPKFAIDAIAAGREGAISLHRYVHEGQSLTLARDPREFYELDKKQAVVPIDCFDAPARQTVAHDASKAKTFSNDRITFTEAQVKAEASRCLGCGVSVVDQNKCIGCGLCTTRCEFDAIHLTARYAGGQPYVPHRGQDEGHPAANGQARSQAHHQGHQGQAREVSRPEETHDARTGNRVLCHPGGRKGRRGKPPDPGRQRHAGGRRRSAASSRTT